MTQDPAKNKAPGGEVTLRTKGFAEGPPGRSMDKKGLLAIYSWYVQETHNPEEVSQNPAPPPPP